MYDFIWDVQTNGIVLTSNHSSIEHELRPVYAKELNMFGFDKLFKYKAQDSLPYMWAESNKYYYLGKLIATIKGACIYKSPQIEVEDDAPVGAELIPVNLEKMIDKNKGIINALAQTTIKKIYSYWMKYRHKMDVFYVAFSGGKDSVVVLDLVEKALPHNEFKVLFGNTQMEFPDTYELIEKLKVHLVEECVQYYEATSHLSPVQSWNTFGPPAQRLRWCCSVLKTTPQILKLREICQKSDIKGMAITGIRAAESESRSLYDEINDGEKIKGQFSYHPILHWNSIEVYLYIYMNSLLLNHAYVKGNGRVGCLVCPMATLKNMYVKEQCYNKPNGLSYGTQVFNDIILKTSTKQLSTKDEIDEFMNSGGWKARRSGREINISHDVYNDTYSDGFLVIESKSLRKDWIQWLKTIGNITEFTDSYFKIVYETNVYNISYDINKDRTTFKLFAIQNKSTIKFMALFKNVVRKSTYCICCKVCVANCPYGYITMDNSTVVIDSKCVKCQKCHEIPNGCLVSNSLRLPKKEKKMSKDGCINRYGNLGVENEWLLSFLIDKNYRPGNKKDGYLKNFLIDSEIINNNTMTEFGYFIKSNGLNTALSWSLILCNIVYRPMFFWWIKNIRKNIEYTSDMIKQMLPDGTTENVKTHIVSAFRVIFISNSILGNNLGCGNCKYSVDSRGGRKLISITRGTWTDPEPLVILYALYKFAVACGDYYEFTLTRLLDHEIDSDGVSPTEIFNLDRETMVPILKGLAINYPEFISVTFTHDLDAISLNREKAPIDVLRLIADGETSRG